MTILKEGDFGMFSARARSRVYDDWSCVETRPHVVEIAVAEQLSVVNRHEMTILLGLGTHARREHPNVFAKLPS